jgi:hypothetical protein
MLRLLACGYVGSTPLAPQTAFSIHLLGFHNHLWHWSTVGTLPFMKTMEAWLEERSSPLLTLKGNVSNGFSFVDRRTYQTNPCFQRRDLCTNFSASVDVYCTLINQTNELFKETLKLNERQILASDACPACFGPTPPQETTPEAQSTNSLAQE